MDFLSKIANVATGGLAETILDAVKTYFPPDMPAEKKAELQIAIERLAMEREKNANDAAREAEQAVNDRLKLYEGTAAELATIPVLGPIMVFARGALRPLIGYATIWLDYNVFAGTWRLEPGAQENCFWVINVLVLGFLFGERALRNLAPVLQVLTSRGPIAK